MPLLISLIVGVCAVNINPGLTDRIWVWFVESWIVKFCMIVVDFRSPASLNNMLLISIVKFHGRVV